MMPPRYYLRRLSYRFQPVFIRGWYAGFQPGLISVATPMALGKRTIFAIASGAEIRIGRNFRTCRDVEIAVHAGGSLEIGDDVYIGHSSVIVCSGKMRIGSNTLIADMVTIRDKEHGFEKGKLIRQSAGVQKDIAIGRNCWLCSKVTITAGAAIGDNVVVGANAVVTKTFGRNLLLGGVPAKVLRTIDCGPDAVGVTV